MKRALPVMVLSALCAVMSTSGVAAAADQDPLALTLDPESVRIVRLELGPTPPAPLPPAPLPPGPVPPGPIPPGPLPPGGINPDIIVNIGKIIMDIIEANRPVVDVKQSYAAAVPSGITHWTQLAGWSVPQTTTYEFTAKNFRGAKIIEVRYQVFRTVGGSYQGKGKYLTGVTIEPISINVSSGFKFYLEASVPPESVANVGTSDDPVAGMVATLKWKIKTTGNETHGARIYYLQGDGVFREIGGNPGAISADARKAATALENPIRWQ